MPTLPGCSYPIGAAVEPGGMNFCIYARNATAIDLLLFDTVDTALSDLADLSDSPMAVSIDQRQSQFRPGHPSFCWAA